MSAASSVMERVRRIRGVSYRWREDAPVRAPGPPGARELGVIAQEVEAVFPDAVRTGKDGFKKVDYIGLVAVLIEAVKELDVRLAEIEAAYARAQDTDGGRAVGRSTAEQTGIHRAGGPIPQSVQNSATQDGGDKDEAHGVRSKGAPDEADAQAHGSSARGRTEDGPPSQATGCEPPTPPDADADSVHWSDERLKQDIRSL